MTLALAIALVTVTVALVAAVAIGRRRVRALAAERDEARSAATRARDDLAATASAVALREKILATMESGVIVAAGRDVLYANPAATSLLGDVPRVLPPWIAAPSDRGPVASVVTLHHPRRREVRVVSASLGAGSVLAVLHDVTEEVRLDGARRDLVANASHEMKTPVAAILATAETLVAALEDDPAAARRFAGALVGEARSLATLLQGLLDLARLDRPAVPPQPVALTDVVEEQVEQIAPRARDAGLRLDAELAQDVVVKGSADDLALLVRNLLDNAVRYTPADGTVSVILEATGAGARLRVRDTGVGIPQRDLTRIFERFYRVDRARSRETGGTGLGLAIVRAVAEAHGAHVTADSELGVGSTFTVTF